MSAAAEISNVLRDPVVVAACSAAAALVLAHSLWPKLRDFTGFQAAVSAYRLMPQAWSRWVALAYAGAEAASVAALVATPLRPGAALLAALAVAIASGAVGINLLRGRRDIRCGCGSAADSLRLSPGLLARNLGLLAVLGLAAATAAGLAADAAPRAFTLPDYLAAGFCALALLLLWLGATQVLVNADRAAAPSRRTHSTYS
ncbi:MULTISPECIES: MauE/DoxX family redox-associated membrane protein [unclassified Cupriavidus]|uniref:MauE/DoxX family redox-associated membrane protein n=1 Tax=unclassified Cupriavidus TaxID=2640874 RepID=UPI00056AC410|nr:MauE/DoxX family redox-associated membrane protein [Cupriavidus sp. SK-3]